MYATPHRLKGSPRAFTKSSGEATGPRTTDQARSAAAVVFQSGNARSRRPLPRTRMLADWGATSSVRRPVSSETRSPAHTAIYTKWPDHGLPSAWMDQERRARPAFPPGPDKAPTECRFLEGDRQHA